MKKVNILFCAVLAVVLILSCFAFTACDDGMFNGIDSQENAATDESLAAFMKNIAPKMVLDGETGLYGVMKGNAYSVEYKNIVESNKRESMEIYTRKKNSAFNGKFNLTDDMTGKFDINLSYNRENIKGDKTTTNKGDIKMDTTVVDNKIYFDSSMDSSNADETLNVKCKSVADTTYNVVCRIAAQIMRLIPIVRETVNLKDFGEKVKEVLRSNSLINSIKTDDETFITPKAYIKGSKMKIVIGNIGYMGMAFDDEWNLGAYDMVIDTRANIGEKDPLTEGNINTGTELRLRKISPSSVSAPSDSGNYSNAEEDKNFNRIMNAVLTYMHS